PTPPATSPLSLHDALPICEAMLTGLYLWLQCRATVPVRAVFHHCASRPGVAPALCPLLPADAQRALLMVLTLSRGTEVSVNIVRDRKSTRLNSSHRTISYA